MTAMLSKLLDFLEWVGIDGAVAWFCFCASSLVIYLIVKLS